MLTGSRSRKMGRMTLSTIRETLHDNVTAAKTSLLVWCAIAWIYSRRDPVRLF